MEQVLERCGGLDVHKKTVGVCLRGPGAPGDRAQHVQTFGTTTAELLTLRNWLEAHGVTHVAMESTGVRPAVAQDRLRQLADGRVVLTLKSPWADGTRQLLFEPLTLLEKLAALIPRPRVNLVVYHGVLAPHGGWRARVVAYGTPPADARPGSEASETSKSAPSPLSVGRADAPRLRPRRAGVPALGGGGYG